jgi:hypothetical protein
MPKLLFVPVSRDALERLCRRASFERRRPQDEAAILIEQALGLRAEVSEPCDPSLEPGRQQAKPSTATEAVAAKGASGEPPARRIFR